MNCEVQISHQSYITIESPSNKKKLLLKVPSKTKLLCMALLIIIHISHQN